MLVSWLPVAQVFLQGLMLTLFPTCPVGQVEEKINFAQKLNVSVFFVLLSFSK